MYNFQVWVDADSFPTKAREFLVSHACSKNVSVKFVANHQIKSCESKVEMIICDKEKNAADDYIFDNSGENDIVVTRDIPFAARLVQKNITVMNDRGLLFTKDNIEDKLREREFSLNMAEIGLGGNKSNIYGPKELRKFSTLFEQEIQKHIIADVYKIKKY